MTKTETEDDLDTLLAGLRQTDLRPSSALQTRVLADALALQTRRAPNLVRPRSRSLGSLLRRASEVFGGGGALAGMSFAAVAGVFIGLAQPEPVAALTQALLAEAPLDSVELLPAANAIWTDD